LFPVSGGYTAVYDVSYTSGGHVSTYAANSNGPLVVPISKGSAAVTVSLVSFTQDQTQPYKAVVQLILDGPVIVVSPPLPGARGGTTLGVQPHPAGGGGPPVGGAPSGEGTTVRPSVGIRA
jgi:hypothetical protein